MTRSSTPEQVNIHYAKTHLSQLLVRVARGEEITIAKAGTPLARLVPIAAKRPTDLFGCMPHLDPVPDSFFEADAEIEAMFHGEQD